MQIKFPVITSATLHRFDFQEEFERLLESDFRELIMISPYMDANVIKNVLKNFRHNDKKLTIVSRYANLYKEEKKAIKAAAEAMNSFSDKDPSVNSRIRWLVNNVLHAKLVVCDWDTLLFGSQNFTINAWKKNHELGALIKGKKDVEKVREFVEDVISNANDTPLFLKDWQ